MELRAGIRIVCAAASALALGGCGSLAAYWQENMDAQGSEQYRAVDRHSSYPALRREPFEQVNLLEMLDPARRSKAWEGVAAGAVSDPQDLGRRYDLALHWFRTSPDGMDEKVQQRDAVQDKMLSVSQSRCNIYKTYMRRQQSDVNFMLGSATTVSGVLGAILQGATASRNLAGMAGLFSGVQAEFNQAYYSNLAAHVIVQGIELRQGRMRAQLVKGRQGRTIVDYSMEAALGDAIIFDGQCSALAGLMEAQESIKELERPGMAMAARAMAGAKALNELNSKPIGELMDNGKLGKLLQVAGADVPSLTITALGADPAGPLALSSAHAAFLRADLDDHLKQQAALVERAYESVQAQASGQQTPGLKGIAVRNAFITAVNDSLLSKLSADNGTLTACTKALASTHGELARLSALSQLAGDGLPKIDARNKVDVARANLNAVISRMALLRTEVESAVSTLRVNAIKALPGNAGDLTGFDGPKLTAAFTGIKGDPAAIKASCS